MDPIKATQVALTQNVIIPTSGAFTVIETGGKQYVVSETTNLRIEKLEQAVGETVVFDKVLLTVDDAGTVTVGTPYIAGASVTATVEAQAQGKKLRVIHFKSKSNRHKTYGHRQPFTAVTATLGTAPVAKKSPAKKKAVTE